jgi:DNA polymerase/3'-5' exonuclease PolX
MTLKSRTWPIAEAREAAEELVSLLGPFCERIEVAGSIRRNRAQVGDIELLAISKTSPAYVLHPDTLRPLFWIHLDAQVRELIAKDLLRYRLNKLGRKTYGRLNKLLIHVASGIPVDLFSTIEENWGMSMVVRTGPKEFNIKMMTRLKALGLQGHAYGGVTDKEGKELTCPTEVEVFRLLQWPYVAPEQRF